MRDVSAKIKTLRVATARAVLKVSPSTIQMIREGRVPKGDPLAVSKVAAIQGAKNTPQIIPYCHPVPLDFVSVDFELQDSAIIVTTTAKAIYKTGVEMEALTAASVAAADAAGSTAGAAGADSLQAARVSMRAEAAAKLARRMYFSLGPRHT